MWHAAWLMHTTDTWHKRNTETQQEGVYIISHNCSKHIFTASLGIMWWHDRAEYILLYDIGRFEKISFEEQWSEK